MTTLQWVLILGPACYLAGLYTTRLWQRHRFKQALDRLWDAGDAVNEHGMPTWHGLALLAMYRAHGFKPPVTSEELELLR